MNPLKFNARNEETLNLYINQSPPVHQAVQLYQAKLTRAEIFENQIEDDDAFINTLEELTSYNASLDISQVPTITKSLEDMVNGITDYTPMTLTSDSDSGATPVKRASKIFGKMVTSSPVKRPEAPNPGSHVRKIVKELQEKEPFATTKTLKDLQEKEAILKTPVKKLSSTRKIPKDHPELEPFIPSVKKLAEELQTKEPFTPSPMKKTSGVVKRTSSSVKKMAEMFNDKITEVLKAPMTGGYKKLENSLSPPPARPPPPVIKKEAPTVSVVKRQAPKPPVPRPRSTHSSECDSDTPKPTPTPRKNKGKPTCIAPRILENMKIFENKADIKFSTTSMVAKKDDQSYETLSVKEKIQLFNRFLSELDQQSTVIKKLPRQQQLIQQERKFQSPKKSKLKTIGKIASPFKKSRRVRHSLFVPTTKRKTIDTKNARLASIIDNAPPLKKRHVRVEMIPSRKFLKSQYLENMFHQWLQDSRGVQVSKPKEPPENELRKTHENSTALSEHQLRVQASLQRLNIPDWFKQYNPTPKENGGYKPGNFSRKRTQESARWTGLNSKTTSLSSLGSQKSERNLILLSPSAHSHHGQTAHSSHTTTQQANGGSQGFGRWSTSHLNSNQISPSTSGRNTFTRGGPVNSSFISVGSSIRNSYRTPYLGWRSQEKLAQPRTPHERLASTLLANKPAKLAEQPEYQIDQPPLPSINHPAGSPEIQSSIKEVTSAIVHYVNDQNNRAPRSRSVSPNSRCWLESSFVGTKPVVKVVVNENGKANGNEHDHNNDNDNDHDHDNDDTSQSQLEVEIDNPIQSYSTPPSPRCWLESSFVGLKPQDSPQTPVIETSTFSNLNSGNNTNISSNNNTTLTSKNASNTSGMNGGVDDEEKPPEYTASLEDVLTSLLGLPPTNPKPQGNGTAPKEPNHRSSGSAASGFRPPTSPNLTVSVQDARFRRKSEGDAPRRKKDLSPQQKSDNNAITTSNNAAAAVAAPPPPQQQQQKTPPRSGSTRRPIHPPPPPPRRISLDSSESRATSELVVKCRNTKCDQQTTLSEGKKNYKSCHNCSYLYCSRECRRTHWEKHRKACLHSRISNLCREVLAACKDDFDTLRHLSLLARKGYLAQGRGVVRILFRSPEAAEGFIRTGFQCLGEAFFVRWPDLMPAEMGVELYSELLKLSTEYKPDSKMLIYVAICVVSEAPSVGTAPVKWERQLVSRCAKLKLCKSVISELSQELQPMIMVSEQTLETLILSFNTSKCTTPAQKELVFTNIDIFLTRRGVILRKHYPDHYQRLQSFVEGQTDRLLPFTLHPRDTTSGEGFVCIIMPVQSDENYVKIPQSDVTNRITKIDVGEDVMES